VRYFQPAPRKRRGLASFLTYRILTTSPAEHCQNGTCRPLTIVFSFHYTAHLWREAARSRAAARKTMHARSLANRPRLRGLDRMTPSSMSFMKPSSSALGEPLDSAAAVRSESNPHTPPSAQLLNGLDSFRPVASRQSTQKIGRMSTLCAKTRPPV
jgi:hypothetical protein